MKLHMGDVPESHLFTLWAQVKLSSIGYKHQIATLDSATCKCTGQTVSQLVINLYKTTKIHNILICQSELK